MKSWDELIELASKAQENAHAPYSGHKVGAALRYTDGAVSSGCNVENASYGATICAERTAVFAGIASGGSRQIQEVVVMSDSPEAWPPCGMCLQVLSEFCTAKTQVHLVNQSGKGQTVTFVELFPKSFSKNFL